MSFNPSGTLYILQGVPFDNTFEHSMDFANLTEQHDWFYDRVFHTCEENTFIRKDDVFRVDYNFEQLYEANYVMYQNATDDKWIYAFIIEKRYLNDNTTELVLETDVFQTYMFNYSWHDSFIEREHQDRWTGVGQPNWNLKDEGLTLGDEYQLEKEQVIAISDVYFLVVSSEPLEGGTVVPNRIQNYPTPFHYYIVQNTPSPGFISAEGLCQLIDQFPSILSVSYIPFLPFDFADLTGVYVDVGGGVNIARIDGEVLCHMTLGTFDVFTSAGMPETFGVGMVRDYGFESKLYSYPYSYSFLTDYQCEPLQLKHEYLTVTDAVEVKAAIGLTHNPVVKYFIGSGYKGDDSGRIFNTINKTVNDLPLKTEEYYNYMLSHKSQLTTGLAVNLIQGVGGTAASLFSGGLTKMAGVGAAGQGIAKIYEQMAMIKDLKNIPDSVRQWGNNIDFYLADGDYIVRVCRFGIVEQIKKIIADFWSKYGYKCSELKVPSLRTRYYYNYIKTIGANLQGNMDNRDLDKLKAIFNNGITIWHNRTGVTPLSYQYDNVEMSLL